VAGFSDAGKPASNRLRTLCCGQCQQDRLELHSARCEHARLPGGQSCYTRRSLCIRLCVPCWAHDVFSPPVLCLRLRALRAAPSQPGRMLRLLEEALEQVALVLPQATEGPAHRSMRASEDPSSSPTPRPPLVQVAQRGIPRVEPGARPPPARRAAAVAREAEQVAVPPIPAEDPTEPEVQPSAGPRERERAVLAATVVVPESSCSAVVAAPRPIVPPRRCASAVLDTRTE
jgi:hypothetical protein